MKPVDYFPGLGIRFFNLLIFLIFKKDGQWSNCSRWSFKKIERDLIALFDLLNRSTVSESILLIFNKGWQEWFDLFHDVIDLSITKSDWFDRRRKLIIKFPTLIIVPVFDLLIFWSWIFNLWSFGLFDIKIMDRDRIALIDL